MYDGTDEQSQSQRSRNRLPVVLALLTVVGVGGALVLVWVFRPREHPHAVRDNPDSLAPVVREAKALPEYAELMANMKRPATDAEFARSVELARHPNAWVRHLARSRLAFVTDGPHRTEAVDTVAGGLREGSFPLRAGALDCLVKLRAVERAAEVRALVASEDEQESAAARRALERMGLRAD